MIEDIIFLRIMLFLSMCWNLMMFFNIRKLENKIYETERSTENSDNQNR